MIRGFADYITEAANECTFAWGRFNPPTTGHEKLLDTVAKVARRNKYFVFASQSNDPKKNPLDYTLKIKYMRRMYPKHARNIVLDNKVKTVFDILVKLYDQGFNKVNMVAGSDRVPEFQALINKYNNIKGRHGFYNFEGGVNVVSAGERDPDADDVSGMSASKMRAAASANDFASFSQGLPKSFKDGQALFNDVRKGMGLKESYDFREHIQLESVSETREAYVQGDLFKEGDIIVVKESEEVGQVIMLGSNYVLVEMADGKKLRKWLDDIEKIEEACWDGYKQVGMKDKNGKKVPNCVPEDKTKISKHTKKYHQMYGEEFKSFSSFNEVITEDVTKALEKKADKTGMPVGVLRQVYNRGLAAWKTSHRPGTTASQWAFARVNSFVTKSKGTWGGADKDLAAKVG